MPRLTAILLCLALAGCGEKELAACTRSSEQLVLLRQMAAVGKEKEQFEQCLGVSFGSPKYCRAVWFDMDGEVRECMAKTGLVFVEGPSGQKCHFMDYDDIACYLPAWQMKLPPDVRAFLRP